MKLLFYNLENVEQSNNKFIHSFTICVNLVTSG